MKLPFAGDRTWWSEVQFFASAERHLACTTNHSPSLQICETAGTKLAVAARFIANARNTERDAEHCRL